MQNVNIGITVYKQPIIGMFDVLWVVIRSKMKRIHGIYMYMYINYSFRILNNQFTIISSSLYTSRNLNKLLQRSMNYLINLI